MTRVAHALPEGCEKRLLLEFSQCQAVVEVQVDFESLLDGSDGFLHGYSALK